MAKGMENTEDPNSEPSFTHYLGTKLFRSKSDYDLYCFYVAGTVGHMMIELVAIHYNLCEETIRTLTDLCEACGRGLQKTNIIKDFRNDLARGSATYLMNGCRRLNIRHYHLTERHRSENRWC
jgi:phytoene/squalene synthetase